MLPVPAAPHGPSPDWCPVPVRSEARRGDPPACSGPPESVRSGSGGLGRGRCLSEFPWLDPGEKVFRYLFAPLDEIGISKSETKSNNEAERRGPPGPDGIKRTARDKLPGAE